MEPMPLSLSLPCVLGPGNTFQKRSVSSPAPVFQQNQQGVCMSFVWKGEQWEQPTVSTRYPWHNTSGHATHYSHKYQRTCDDGLAVG